MEREARALEREAGGWPVVGATFQDLRTAARTMTSYAQAFEAERLSPETSDFWRTSFRK